jgi:hypothetical protein
MSAPGTNAKSGNVRATVAFGAEGDINQNIRVVSSLITLCGHFRRSSEVS